MDDPNLTPPLVLESEYCPPLDPALFAAISNDYDLTDGASIHQLRETLECLKGLASEQEQEELLFDPSGTSGFDPRENAGALACGQSESQGTLKSHETAITSIGSDLSSLRIESDKDNPKKDKSLIQKAERPDLHTDLGGDTSYLTEMFPSIKQFTIDHTLKQCDGDIDRAMDVLLNFAFFEQYEADGETDDHISIPKGIDGFKQESEEANIRKTRKKGKKENHRNKSLLVSHDNLPESHTAPNVENRWDHGRKDIDFISSRTILSVPAVQSAYHLNGASLPNTIYSLVREEAGKSSTDTVKESSVTSSQIAELQEEFQNVSSEMLAALLKLTRNSISAANELATIMITERRPEIWQTVVGNEYASRSKTSTKTPKQTPPTKRSENSYTSSRALAEAYLSAGHTAFAQAEAAYRRSKSDPLMGSAAGYYSALGRDHMEKAKKEVAAAADALVESQSTSIVLDLHGVSVQDAIRIANRRVEAWWESLGDSKYTAQGRKEAKQGFQIITGLGRHSKNSTARLGPAVARSLAKEGWKVEVGQGVLYISGVVRY
ncbi:hypothetical protein FQN57_004795 [Myotisia sp. PD_48]|nr:hypothetical protein FQN57_004795 [Myotisia sp. PD_48]